MRLNRNKILLLIAEMGYNQTELAIISGVSRQTLSAVMNGRNCNPVILNKISSALKVKPSEIVETEN